MIEANAESDRADSGRRFYRDGDRAVLGGVCAGIAGYMGFNLKVTRLLAFIAFLMAMPFVVIGYIAAVFLVPSRSYRDFDVPYEKETRRSRRRCRRERKRQAKETSAANRSAERSAIVSDIDRRCESMDRRLADLEKHVTSPRFQIDQELGRL